MPQLVTDLVELAVGVACIGVAAMSWRRGLRSIAVAFALAGSVAATHAVWSMLSGSS